MAIKADFLQSTPLDEWNWLSIDPYGPWLSESEQTGIFSTLEAINQHKIFLTRQGNQERTNWILVKETLSDANYKSGQRDFAQNYLQGLTKYIVPDSALHQQLNEIIVRSLA